MRRHNLLSRDQFEAFVASHRLPDDFYELVGDRYLQLAAWLASRLHLRDVFVIGISGAQGSGKSTLAHFLQIALQSSVGLRAAVLSLDDFYLTKAERACLGARIHPLLETRGVPGTHDVELLGRCLDKLATLAAGEAFVLPRFDKASDDRAEQCDRDVITGPLDVILLEGWCLGGEPQPDDALEEPVNALERERDADGVWRRFVNEQLAGPYAGLFARLDMLLFLQVPGFASVYRWRLEQEHKLADKTSHPGSSVMSNAEVTTFIQHFERISRSMLRALPDKADAVLQLNERHGCERLLIRAAGQPQ